MPSSGCARKMTQVLDGLERTVLIGRNNCSMQREYLSRDCPWVGEAKTSRLQGLPNVAHLFVASQGQHGTGDVNAPFSVATTRPELPVPSPGPGQARSDCTDQDVIITQAFLLNLHSPGYLSYKKSSVFIKSLKFLFLETSGGALRRKPSLSPEPNLTLSWPNLQTARFLLSDCICDHILFALLRFGRASSCLKLCL